ncbi:MAG: glyoxalase/bleomycin resistance protein/dioxygenase [Puniceicoccaceae bacterium 5H]|nr:MAG: glyoxalase/bleomycin resistance protein/dioxygenase [Puniceicoccaceae bacterium 5H]
MSTSADTTATPVKPVPEFMHTVTPHLICRDAMGAVEFYKKAFGAQALVVMPMPDGKALMHAMLQIGDAHIMLGEENEKWGCLGPLTLKGSPVSIHLQVEDVDAAFAQAVEAGAKVTMPLENMFWGDRYGVVEDPYGHKWSLASTVAQPTPEEMQAAAAKMFAEGGGCGE